MQIMELRVRLGQKARAKEANLGLREPHVQKIFSRKNGHVVGRYLPPER